jgi:hypothetical protein
VPGSQYPDAPGSGAGGADRGRPDARRSLLAVDAGLRAGIAVYRGDGRLESYRSTNFGSIRRLKSGVYGVTRKVEGLAEVVVEGGGGGYAEPWLKEAHRRGIPGRAVDARVWRERLLLPRDRRTGVAAKEQADTLARRVIAWSGAPSPTALRHDAAEAILVGLWAVLEAGWLSEVPEAVREG